MKDIILQKLLFCPDERLDKNMFYRTEHSNSHCICTKEALLMNGDVWKANTYFNSFSMQKWMKYTIIKNIFLVLRIKGICEISVYGTYISHGRLYGRKISHGTYGNAVKMEEVRIAIPAQERFQSIYFKICARGQTCFYGGYYSTDMQMHNEVKLAVAICTYHRRQYIQQTVMRLEKQVFCNPDSVLKNRLHVFLVDNSGSNDMKIYETENIHVFSQREKGSSGGFARGLLETEKRKEYTHCILMDDDIFLYTEVLERLYRFLCYIKKQYGAAIIGGGLLRADLPYLQHEAGAVWNAGMIKGCKSGYDLRDYKKSVRNEIEEPASYMGWWMCCIPMQVLKKRGYPLPLYFHKDDIEFGLRNTMQMTLNGICVWHEPFEAKTDIVNEYYDIRNTGIINALHRVSHGKRIYMMYLAKRVVVNLFRYKYRAVELILKGAEDFLKQPNQIVAMDCGAFYRRLKKNSYPEYNAGRSYTGRIQTAGRDIPAWMKIITFNGAIFPGRGKKAVCAFEPNTDLFWRLKEAYFYNPYTNTYIKTVRSNRQAAKYMLRLVCILLQTACSYHKVSLEWRKKFCELASAEHWWKLLKG